MAIDDSIGQVAALRASIEPQEGDLGRIASQLESECQRLNTVSASVEETAGQAEGAADGLADLHEQTSAIGYGTDTAQVEAVKESTSEAAESLRASAHRSRDLAGWLRAAHQECEALLGTLSAVGDGLAQAEALLARAKTHRAGSGVGGAPSPIAAGPAARGTESEPVGTWVWPPKRTHDHKRGSTFNADYERYVKRSNGGPDDGREYLVKHGRWQAHFDAIRLERNSAGATEILIDAKGRYGQFVDKRTGEFHAFFRASEKSGIKKLEEEARRQTLAANGKPVEWWCADELAADAFDDWFDRIPDLQGKIEVLYEPMPDKE